MKSYRGSRLFWSAAFSQLTGWIAENTGKYICEFCKEAYYVFGSQHPDLIATGPLGLSNSVPNQEPIKPAIMFPSTPLGTSRPNKLPLNQPISPPTRSIQSRYPWIILHSSGLLLVMLGSVEYTSSSSWWRNLKCLC